MSIELPEWLQPLPPPPPPEPTPEAMENSRQLTATRMALELENRHTRFANIFYQVLSQLVGGDSLKIIMSRFNQLDLLPAFLRWMLRDPERKQKYYEALEIQAEVLSSQLIGIADGEDNPMEDVQRSALRVKVRQWQMGVANRKRFGDIKQLDVTSTVIDRDSLRTMTTEDIKRMALSGEYRAISDVEDVVEELPVIPETKTA